MILNKDKIQEYIDKGDIIYKFPNQNETELLTKVLKDQSIDISIYPQCYCNGKLINLPYNFKKGDFVLACTNEFIGTKGGSGILPSFKLKSSAGRNGIIHTLAGHGEVGFHNRWAMEFILAKDITIEPNTLIGQIYFTLIDGGYADYSLTGTYQKTSNTKDLIQTWKITDILPPKLKVIV